MFWSVVQKSINRETLGSRQLSDKNLQDTLNKKKSRYGRLGCFFLFSGKGENKCYVPSLLSYPQRNSRSSQKTLITNVVRRERELLGWCPFQFLIKSGLLREVCLNFSAQPSVKTMQTTVLPALFTDTPQALRTGHRTGTNKYLVSEKMGNEGERPGCISLLFFFF